MKPILVLYATREGQTRRVAEHIGDLLRSRGLLIELKDAKALHEPFSLSAYSAAILCASVHAGRHEEEMVAFVKRHLPELAALPTAFLSVSLSEAGAEDVAKSPAQRAQAAADVAKMIDDFLAKTGWHPGNIFPVAGALRYTQYGALIRFVMKRIARNAGASTDTSRDHEFTNWTALDYFVSTFLAEISPAPSQDGPAPPSEGPLC